MMKKNEKYLVVGSGVSGIASCSLLDKMNKDYTLFDENPDLDIELLKKERGLPEDARVITGKIPDMTEYSVAVLSPGVPLDKPLVQSLREAGVRISGEIELAYSFARGKLCAITGTNGKTTTTTLVGELLKRAFDDVYVVGNIGTPYTSIAADTTDDSVCVAEISSFQLETADTFRPMVSAILNITPDHLDRHHTMENYAEAKESIVKNAGPEDVLVLNYEDDRLREFGEKVPCRVVWFSSERELKEGFFLRDGSILYSDGEKSIRWIETSELNILGKHNHENAMAAMAVAEAMGVGREDIIQGLKEFTAVEHRIEYVCEAEGVKFYNDSKGTNPDAAIKAVEAMERPVCLIGGGYDKSASYDDWVETFDGRVKHLTLIGETAEKIAECAKAHGFTAYEFADSLKDAVEKSFEAAEPGDAILLSPACASWDMFKNYEVRGDEFKELARGYGKYSK